MSYRRPGGPGGDPRDNRYGEYAHSRTQSNDEYNSSPYGRVLPESYPNRQPPGTSHGRSYSYDEYHQPHSPVPSRSGSDRYGMSVISGAHPRTPPRAGVSTPPSSSTPDSYGYGRRISHETENGGHFMTQQQHPQHAFLDAEVARARVSDSSSYPSSGQNDSGGEQGMGVGVGVNLKDDQADEFYSHPFGNLRAIREERRISGVGNLPQTLRRKPIKPIDGGATVEPSLPSLEDSRRYKRTNDKRIPDLCRGDTRLQHLRNDEHVIQCSACRSQLKVKKASVLVRCPNCSKIGPTIARPSMGMR
jgi:predicted RNA-binding Zn-ribbon protein involved in translation (DUF1610 family)